MMGLEIPTAARAVPPARLTSNVFTASTPTCSEYSATTGMASRRTRWGVIGSQSAGVIACCSTSAMIPSPIKRTKRPRARHGTVYKYCMDVWYHAMAWLGKR